ncbi:uncharacterized protein [Lepisosteus oculatus]|uniref:uncharacterized protein isoform X1 n=1 Tax=Lepisosteus oculatus TaxID=7918 RepID=UPI0035F52981
MTLCEITMLLILFFTQTVANVEVRPDYSAIFGSVEIEVDLKQINKEEQVMIRCEAARGTWCHFYTLQSETPFKSVPFREEYKVCFLTASGKELLGQRGSGIRTEVVLSCAVELDTQEQTATSQRSQSITVEVEGLENKEVTSTAAIITNATGSEVSISAAAGPGDSKKKTIWVAVCVVLFLMAAVILAFLYFRSRQNKKNSERNLSSCRHLQNRTMDSDTGIYANIHIQHTNKLHY